MMLRVLLLAACPLVAAGSSVVSLDGSNFHQLTESKSVFIKFFAPWCGHCQAMADDWERLADDWKDSETGLVAEVDCTAEKSEGLCQDFDIEGFPTLLYGDVHSPQPYEGDREYAVLSEFAKDVLSSLPCTLNTMEETCPESVQTILKEFMAKSRAELQEMESAVDAQLAEAEDEFDELMNKLNDQYQEMLNDHNRKLESLRDLSNYRYLQMVLKQTDESLDEMIEQEKQKQSADDEL